MDIEKTIERVMREVQQTEPSSPVTMRKVVRTPARADIRPESVQSPTPAKRTFVIVTEDYSGLGWAKKLMEEDEQVVLATKPGDDEDDKKLYDEVGHGWVPKLALDEAIKKLKSDKTYWIFAENHLTKVADQLRKEGQKVFGTSELSEKMEHDRAFGVKVAKDAGLDSPENKEFKTIEEGLKFLDANPDKAYVFKPDDAEFNRLTHVPGRERSSDANRETYNYLKHLTEFNGTYILQERKYGVEVNVEVWLQEGEPFFAFCGLELKRKGVHDSGEMMGCAGDVVFTVPVDSELVRLTVGKMLPFYKKEKYTGFADVNVIIGDNKVWFLEVCDRFGYNSHPNLFMTLALDGFGDIMADFMDGKTKGMAKRFRKGFGASLSLSIDHPRAGLPLHLHEDQSKRFYPYDGHKEGDDILLGGYSNDVGIFADFDYTLEGAVESMFQKFYYAEAVYFSEMAFRDDLGKRNYTNAPIRRYEALQAMGLL